MTTIRETRTFRADVLQLAALGSFLEVEVTGTSKLFAQVNWNALGIPASDPRIKEITPGRRAVVPAVLAREQRRLEGALRDNLDRYSRNVGLPWLSYRLVPSTAYAEWERGHDRLEREFYAHKRFILAQWDIITEDTVVLYAEFAGRAWRACRDLDPTTPPRGAFVQQVVNEALNALARRRELLDACLQVRVHRAVIEDTASLAQRVAVQEAANLEASGYRLDQQALVRQKELELEQARLDLEQYGSPVRRLMDGMMSDIYAGATSIARTLRTRGTLPPATLAQAKGLAQIYRLFAVQDHPELEQALAAYEQAISGGLSRKKPATVAAAVSALQRLRELTVESADRIGGTSDPSRASMMLLADDDPLFEEGETA